MNRRSFLSALAAIPGLGWVKPAETPKPKVCQRAADIRLLYQAGASPGSILYGISDVPCDCAECHELERTLRLRQIDILQDDARRLQRMFNETNCTIRVHL